jgi:DNA-binding phage protein
MSNAQIIKRLREAADQKVLADAERHAASERLRVAILQAREAGLGVTEISRETNLSRQAIYEALGVQASQQA